MEQKGNKPRKTLTLKEQKAIVPATYTGGLNYAIGFNGSYKTKNIHTGEMVQCGGGAILRSDGKYHTESLEELAKQGIYPR